MKLKYSPQTKSFIILFTIAFIGACACLIVAKSINFPGNLAAIERIELGYLNNNSSGAGAFPQHIYLPKDSTSTVDTTGWATYTNPTYNFSLQYPPAWKFSAPKTENGYYVIAIDPGSRYFDIKIYISPIGLFAMDNLPSTTIVVAGEQTADVEGVLYGLQHGGNYYTFDQGLSQTIKPQFEAMVKSLKF